MLPLLVTAAESDPIVLVSKQADRLLKDVIYNLQKDVVRVMLLAFAGFLMRNLAALVGQAPRLPTPQIIAGVVAFVAGGIALLTSSSSTPSAVSPAPSSTSALLNLLGLEQPPPVEPAAARSAVQRAFGFLGTYPLTTGMAMLLLLVVADQHDLLLRLVRSVAKEASRVWPHLVRIFKLPAAPKTPKPGPTHWAKALRGVLVMPPAVFLLVRSFAARQRAASRERLRLLRARPFNVKVRDAAARTVGSVRNWLDELWTEIGETVPRKKSEPP